MKKTLLSAFLFVLVFAAKAQTAEEIVAKHLEAMGGDALGNVKTMKMECKISVQAAPGMEIPMTMTVVNNKAARIDVTVMGMTQSTCINGDKGWANNPFAGQTDAEPLTADQVTEMKDMTDLSGSLYNYKAKGYTVEYVGKEDLEGTEVHKIKIVKSPTKTEYALIDPENWYQIKNITVSTVDGKEITAESLFSNFKKEGALVFPYTIEQNNPMMGTSVTTVTAIKLNEAVEEKAFDMPAKK
jgi:hypothetical protein